jgi:hypothetical protein
VQCSAASRGEKTSNQVAVGGEGRGADLSYSAGCGALEMGSSKSLDLKFKKPVENP